MGRVVIGMDPHKRSATIEVIDERERVLAKGRFGTEVDGYQRRGNTSIQPLSRLTTGFLQHPPSQRHDQAFPFGIWNKSCWGYDALSRMVPANEGFQSCNSTGLNVDLRLMLNESHRYVGDMLLKLGEVEQAAQHYRKQLALNQEMVAADPANAQFRHNQAVALIKIGDVEARTGKTASALSNYNEALRIREQLSSDAPQDIYIQRDLAEVKSKLATLKSARN